MELKKTFLSYLVLSAVAIPALAGSVTVYPGTANVEFLTSEPFQAAVSGTTNQSVTWLVNGIAGGNATIGTINSAGVYRAPSSNPGAVTITAHSTVTGITDGVSHVTDSASIPSYSCTYTNKGTGLTGHNNCTMQHDGITRNYIVHIPSNYVAGASALIMALSPGDVMYTNECQPYAGSETRGLVPYTDTLPSPAPVVVCPESERVLNTFTGLQPPWWNAFGDDTAAWVNGAPPNDSDFIRQVALSVIKDLSLNPQKTFVTGDYNVSSQMVQRICTEQSDLFAACGAYLTATKIPSGGLPPPVTPVSIVFLEASYNQTQANLCGHVAPVNPGDTLPPIDTLISYWTAPNADNISNFSYGDPSGSNTLFCTGQNDSSGYGLATTLQKKDGTGGILGTEVAVWKIVIGVNKVYCSLDWNGNDTYCNTSQGSTTPTELNNSVCSVMQPCNLYVNSQTGVDLNGMYWRFFLNHPKGGSGAPPPPTFTLSVARSGSGSGTVTSSPSGITCGATCSANFASGTTVALTATPATGSKFAGWSGACSGTSSCNVTLTSNQSVTATFNPAPAALPPARVVGLMWQ